MATEGGPDVGRRRERIAVLGGGCAALAAVFAITDDPHWQDKYDITVYERGWRLGGKGASGVNLDAGSGNRIEEHGLHVWSGFYENAFWLMRRCYAELDRPRQHPLASWQSAFTPHDFGGFKHYDGDRWYNWLSYLPRAPGLPGDIQMDALSFALAERYKRPQPPGVPTDEHTTDPPTPWQYFRELLPWSIRYLQSAPSVRSAPVAQATPNRITAWLFGDGVSRYGFWGSLKFVADSAVAAIAVFLLRFALYFANLGHSTHPLLRHSQSALLKFLLKISGLWIGFNFVFEKQRPDKRRFYILADTVIAMLRGMLDDDVLTRGFDVIDDQDFAAWLGANGARPQTRDSGAVRAAYSYLFAFEDGAWQDQPHRRLAAGVGLRMILRLLLSSRGGVFWKMNAGMGDAVFAPLYLVLRRRGVKFAFFHRVLSMTSNSGDAVNRITFGRQVELRADVREYRPLINVKGLPCWPAAPLYDQLAQGDELRAKYVSVPCDLDSAYTDWPDVGEPLELVLGEHFDQVILGISIGALEYVCPDLVKQDSGLTQACAALKTTATQSAQLWMRRELVELGWQLPSPVVTAFAGPLDTWADMTHLLERESWPAAVGIRSLAYLVGPMEFPACPPGSRPDILDTARQRVARTTVDWLAENAMGCWPRVALSQGNLAAAQPIMGLVGGDVAAAYVKANIDPSERYVLSLPGTTGARMEPNGTCYQNLYLAGDWIRTGLNYGCVEGAVIGGFKAARALCGWPHKIFGEADLPVTDAPIPAPTLPVGPMPCMPPVTSADPAAPTERADPVIEGRPPLANPPEFIGVAPRTSPFIRRGGSHTMPPPWIAKDVDMHAFYLRCDPQALQELCDRCLNRPSGNVFAFQPTTRYVMLTFQRFDDLHTTASGYENIGFVQENEAALWLFVSDRNGSRLPDGNDWSAFVPFMVTDDPIALLTGREVYGFPKELGAVSLTGGASPFSVEVHAFSSDDASQPIIRRELIAMVRGEVSSEGGRIPVFTQKASAAFEANVNPSSKPPLAAFENSMLAYNPALEEDLDPELLAMLKDLMDMLLRGRLDFVFLKEFRAISGGEFADSCSVAMAHQENMRIRSADILPPGKRFRFMDFASHPLITDLGLERDTASGQVEVALAVNVRVDFDFMPGQILLDGS